MATTFETLELLTPTPSLETWFYTSNHETAEPEKRELVSIAEIRLQRRFEGRAWKPHSPTELPPNALCQGVSLEIAIAAADEWNEAHPLADQWATPVCYQRKGERFGTVLFSINWLRESGKPTDYRNPPKSIVIETLADRDEAMRKVHALNHHIIEVAEQPRRWHIAIPHVIGE